MNITKFSTKKGPLIDWSVHQYFLNHSSLVTHDLGMPHYPQALVFTIRLVKNINTSKFNNLTFQDQITQQFPFDNLQSPWNFKLISSLSPKQVLSHQALIIHFLHHQPP